MRAYLRRHHLALLALFIALGGTSYAATQLPRDSVGTKQIRDGAVTLRKLNGKAQRSLSGDPFPRVLPAGKTVRGAFPMSDYKHEDDAFQEAETGISFGFALAKAPVPHFPARLRQNRGADRGVDLDHARRRRLLLEPWDLGRHLAQLRRARQDSNL